MNTDFAMWMQQNTKLSDSSIGKYARAIATVSREMLEYGVISKDLQYMNLAEFEGILPVIFANKQFIDKNTRGNKMYSNALKQYRSYRTMTDK